MRKINNIEKVLSTYNTWTPSDIAFIKTLEWSNDNIEIIFYCQSRNNINKWPDDSNTFFELSISFKNVSNLKLNFNHSGIQQISGFDIIDVSDNGFEKINFEIEDYENGSIGFSCGEITIKSISSPFILPFPSSK